MGCGLTEAAEGSNGGLTTTERHRERPDVELHHIFVVDQPRPTRGGAKATGQGQQADPGVGASRLPSGRLPRIHLPMVGYLQRSWSLTNFGSTSRLRVRSQHVLQPCVVVGRQKQVCVAASGPGLVAQSQQKHGHRWPRKCGHNGSWAGPFGCQKAPTAQTPRVQTQTKRMCHGGRRGPWPKLFPFFRSKKQVCAPCCTVA